MKANIGPSDKLIRLLLAIILILLYYFDILSDTWGIVALIGALVLTVTSLINFCPLYPIFKIDTNKKKEKTA
ncbi:MAG: DUF2892 domain-containing protein [Paludibacter sp.]